MPVAICCECQTAFEPPFDADKFLVWLNACQDIEDYLCLECADLQIFESDTITVISE